MSQDANLTVTETLFNAMLKEDSDLPKFKIMPGITDLLEEFEVWPHAPGPRAMRQLWRSTSLPTVRRDPRVRGAG